MRTCLASQCQDGDELLKCYESRCQGIKASYERTHQEGLYKQVFFERVEFFFVTTNPG